MQQNISFISTQQSNEPEWANRLPEAKLSLPLLLDIEWLEDSSPFKPNLKRKRDSNESDSSQNERDLKILRSTSPTVDEVITKKFISELRARNIGHLMGDAFLKGFKDETGCELEGICLEQCLDFFDATIHYLFQKYSQKFSKEDHENISQFQKHFKSLIEYEDLLFDAKNEGENDQSISLIEAVSKISKQMTIQVLFLEEKESFVFPLGWGAKAGCGHAMLGAIKKHQNQFKLYIFNTGSGQQFHENEFNGAKAYHQCVRTYLLPRNLFDHSYFFQTLLEPMTIVAYEKLMYEKRTFDEQDIYPFLEHYALVNSAEDHSLNVWMSTQLSGTCGFRSVCAFFIFCCGKSLFKEFKFLWEKEVFEQLIKSAENGQPMSQCILKILSLQLPNLFRHYEKILKTQTVTLNKVNNVTNAVLDLSQEHFDLKNKELEGVDQLQHFKYQLETLAPNYVENPPFNIPSSLDNKLSSVIQAALLRKAPKNVDDPAIFLSSNVQEKGEYSDYNLITWPLWPLQQAHLSAELLNSLLKNFLNVHQDKRKNEEDDGTPYITELLAQVGRIFTDPKEIKLKQSLIESYSKDIKLCEELCETLTNLVYEVCFPNHFSLKVSIALHSALVVVWQICQLLDNLKGFTGSQRIDYYPIYCQEFLEIETSSAGYPGFFTYQWEQDYFHLASALKEMKKQASFCAQSRKDELFNFIDMPISGSGDGILCNELSADYAYAKAHAQLNLLKRDWFAIDNEYERHVEENPSAEIEKEKWRIFWVYTHQDDSWLPRHFPHLRSLAWYTLFNFNDFLEDNPSIEPGPLTFDRPIFNEEEEELECYITNTNEGLKINQIDYDVKMIPGDPYYSTESTDGELFLKAFNRQNQNLLASSPPCYELMSAHTTDSGLHVTLLMDIFEKSPLKFLDKVNQAYFEYVLFHPLRLTQALRNNPLLSQQLIHFYEDLLNYYQVHALGSIKEEDRLNVILFLFQNYQRTLTWFVGENFPGAEERIEKIRENLRFCLKRSEYSSEQFQAHLLFLLKNSYNHLKQLTLNQIEEIILSQAQLYKLEQTPEFEAYSFSLCDFWLETTVHYECQHYHAIQQNLNQLENPKVLEQVLTLYGIKSSSSLIWKKKSFPEWECEIDRNIYQINVITGRFLKNQGFVDRNFLYSYINSSRLSSDINPNLQGENFGDYFLTKDKLGSIVVYQKKECFRSIEGEWFVYRDLTIHEIENIIPTDLSITNKWWCLNPNFPIRMLNIDSKGHIIYRINQSGAFAFGEAKDDFYEFIEVSPLKINQILTNFNPLFSLLKSCRNPQQMRLQFPGYLDEENQEIVFENRQIKDKTDQWIERWIWTKDPQFYISPQQRLKGIQHFNCFLILENKEGQKEVLIPKYGLNRFKSIKEITKVKLSFCYRIHLKNDQIVPFANSSKNIYLAYLHLCYAVTPENYLNVLSFLQAASSHKRYSLNEIKELIDLIYFNKETGDHTPDAYALRLYAAWLLYDNLVHFPLPKRVMADFRNSLKTVQTPPSELTSKNHKKWQRFIYNYETQGCSSIWLSSLISAYLERENNVQKRLKITQLVRSPYLLRWGYLQALKIPFHAGISFASNKLAINASLNSLLSNKEIKWELIGSNPVEEWPPFITRMKNDFNNYFGYLYQLAKKGLPLDLQKLKTFLKAHVNENDQSTNYILQAILYAQILLKENRIVNDNFETICQQMISFGEKIIQKINLTVDEKSTLTKLIQQFYFSIDFQGVYIPPSLSLIHPVASVKPQKSLTISASFYPSKDFKWTMTPHLFKTFNELYFKYFDEYTPLEQMTMSEPFTFSSSKDLFIQSSIEHLNRDYLEGAKKNQTQRSYFTSLNPSQILQLRQDRELLKQQVENDLLEIETFIFDIEMRANSCLKKDLNLKIKVGANKKFILSFDDCVKLFLREDIGLFKKQTGIQDIHQLNHLYQMIGSCLELKLKVSQAKKILDQMENILACESSIEQSEYVQNLQELLRCQHHVMPDRHPPAVLVFEYYLNVILKENQVEGLSKLLRKNPSQPTMMTDVFVQQLQAAGKTFVWGHLLAYLKADGYHLSIMVFPSHQFASTVTDMTQRSKEVFGQHSWPLVFNDEPEFFTTEYLTLLLNDLKKTMVDREYIQTTVETLRALRCKFIKTGLEIFQNFSNEKFNEGIESLKPCYLLLGEILGLLRSRAIFTIDEIHEALDPRKELNMPFGDSVHIDLAQAQLVAKLIFYTTEMNQSNSQITPLTPDQWKQLKRTLVEKLLKDSDTQKLLGISELTPIDELKNYLINPSVSLPTCYHLIKTLNKDEVEGSSVTDLVILAHQLIAQEWLYESLKKRLHEHHGIVFEKNMIPISIPFIANMRPAKGSEFSDRFVMITNTLIAYSVTGLHSTQVMEFILHFKREALQEFEQKKLTQANISLEQTQVVQDFNLLLQKNDQDNTQLFKIDMADSQLMHKLQGVFNSPHPVARKLILDFVIKKVIKKVDFYDEQVCSHGQNMATMALSINGYSGTLDHPLMAPVMDDKGRCVEMEFDKGTNGQTIDLLRRQNAEVWVINANPQSLFENFISHCSEEIQLRIHAIIDAGCLFRGMQNHEVADLICTHLRHPRIKGILFFDSETRQLCCMNKQTKKVIKLSGTSAAIIRKETKYLPQELFTYYDQDHITGTDIAQTKDAIAISTFSEHLFLHQKLQGDRRMRQLDRFQRILTAIPRESLKPISLLLDKPEMERMKMGQVKSENFISDLILYAHLNASFNERNLNLMYTLQKMENFIQQYLLDGLYDGKLQPEVVFGDFAHLFKKKTVIELYKQYGHGRENKEIIIYLQQYKNQLMETFYQINFNTSERISLKLYLDRMTEEALQHGLNPQIEISRTDPSEPNSPIYYHNREATMVQIRQQNQTKEHNRENENIVENSNEKVSLTDAAIYQPFKPEAFFDSTFFNLMQPLVLALQSHPQGGDYFFIFDQDILLTTNFIATVQYQNNSLGLFKKPILHTLLVREMKGQHIEWKIVIGSVEDNDYFARSLDQKDQCLQMKTRQAWLLRTNAELAWPSPFSYDREALLKDEKAQRLFMQVHLYNGNVSILDQKFWLDILKNWLKTKTDAERIKIQKFFENTILRGKLPDDYLYSRLRNCWNKK